MAFASLAAVVVVGDDPLNATYWARADVGSVTLAMQDSAGVWYLKTYDPTVPINTWIASLLVLDVTKIIKVRSVLGSVNVATGAISF